MSRFDALVDLSVGGRHLPFLGRRAAWHHPVVRVESSSLAPRVLFNRDIVAGFSAGPDALLEAIEKSLDALDDATTSSSDSPPREYIERSFAERQTRFHELIASLRQAFDDEDMVTAYSEWVTLRWLLNELRFAAKDERGERWHMFGAIHDAVAFTSIDRLRLPMVEAVSRAFTLACSAKAKFIDVHRSLRDGGLDLTPQRPR